MRSRQLAAVGGAGLAVALAFIGTAVAGTRGSLERDAHIRARVWCEAVVARDALRYRDTFRRGYFRGEFDRFANVYREPKESAILAQMPRAQSCHATDGIRGPGLRGDVYVPVEWRDEGRVHYAQLRMRREAGFLVVVDVE